MLLEPINGKQRVVIEKVRPEVENGRFPIKRTVGEPVRVEADVFADGHEVLAGVLLYRLESDTVWQEASLEFLINDRWQGEFTVKTPGRYRYTLRAWVDSFLTWKRDLRTRYDAGQDLALEFLKGSALVRGSATRAAGADRMRLEEGVALIEGSVDPEVKMEAILGRELEVLMSRYPDCSLAVEYERELEVVVDRERARFSTWYEIFPRSCGPTPGIHGKFKDCEARLPYIASLGFDVLYLPPIHPIGFSFRKGKNNQVGAQSDDPGSPWAIGSREGGHTSVHPDLGTLDDFRAFSKKAESLGIELALDLAFQCSPDHPWVKEHPQWFLKKPDGTIQYAENPPKKYEDIYPLNFENEDWPALWEALKSVVLFWVGEGIRIFRVDNPHTKPFLFWEWLIREIKKEFPDILFLAEAFTRPKVTSRLAKLGFTQSYSYFAWRNAKGEITDYFQQLTQTELREFFRPNLWPNTPDILTEYLQFGGRPAFIIRLILAATLGASYGIYGPAFELCENQPRDFGSEEYLNSEKYEIRSWNLEQAGNFKELIARVNRIRRENQALQQDWTLRFQVVDNEQLLCYSKHTADFSNLILTVVNLDPHHVQSGWVHFPLEQVGVEGDRPYQVHDLLSDARYLWQGERNYVELDPRVMPAQIFRVRKRIRSERDFDYYL